MKKLKIETRCISDVSFDGKELDENWLKRNKLLKLETEDDSIIILTDENNIKTKYNEDEFEKYLLTHK